VRPIDAYAPFSTLPRAPSSSSLVLITAGTLPRSIAGSYRAAITRYRDAPMITEVLCFHSARHLWHRCLIVHSLIKRRTIFS